MADDTVLSLGVGTGDTIRDLDDGSRKWPVSALAYPTHVSTGPSDPWVFQVVDATHGAPVAVIGHVVVDYGLGTFAISAAALPLPAGAATAANQATEIASLASIDGKTPALGQALAAGSVPVVLTVAQLATLAPFSTVAISGSVAVTGTFFQATQPVSLASLPALAAGTAVIGHVILDAGTAVIGHVIVDSGAITFSNTTIAVTNTGTFAVQATLTAETTKVIGTVNLAAGQTIGVTGTFWQVTQPVSGTFWQATQPVSGTFFQATQPISVADGSDVAQGALADAIVAAGATGSLSAKLRRATQGLEDLKSLIVLAAGTNVIGHVIVDSGTVTTVSTVTTVTTVSAVTAITNALPSGTNNIGQVSLAPQTSNGLSVYSVISSGAANQDSAAVKGSAGQVYGYSLFNTTASARYVKLYNLASGATSGSTPVLRIYLPPTGGANLSMENGLAFGTGICLRITTGAGDSDTGACSANDVLANVFYK